MIDAYDMIVSERTEHTEERDNTRSMLDPNRIVPNLHLEEHDSDAELGVGFYVGFLWDDDLSPLSEDHYPDFC